VLGRERTALFLQGHQVREDLAGMRAIGQGVDYRLPGGGSELDEVVMCSQTRHDAVHVTVEHPGGIAHRLPDAYLNVLLGQGRRRTPQAGYPDLERHPGPVRGLLEQHRDMPALERPLRPPAGLDRVREVKHLPQLGLVEVRDVQEVTAQQSAH
jgi:hypothetical protein